jgi:hypothetical protein
VVICGELDLQRGVGPQNSRLQPLRFAKPIFFEIQTGMLDVDAFQLYFLVETKATQRGDKNGKFEITLRAQAVNGKFNMFRDSKSTIRDEYEVIVMYVRF